MRFFLKLHINFDVVHVKRKILNCASHKDKSQLAEELNEVFTLENKEMKSLLGYQQFITFVAIWEKKYPVLKKYKAERNIAYFTYMDFPVQVQRAYIRQIGLKDSIENIREQ